MNRNIFSIIVIAAISATVSYANTITGPVYPPPGGNSFGTTSIFGDAVGDTGGLVSFYYNFNPTAYGQLYFGMSEVDNVYNPAVTGGPTGQMQFVGYNATTGISTWESTVSLQYYDRSGDFESFTTLFEMQVQPYLGVNEGVLSQGFLPMVSDSSVGISGGADVYHVTSGQFQVWTEFIDAFDGEGVDTAFDNNNSGAGFIETDKDGGFWFTAAPPPTPEPATFVMMGLALAGFAAVRHKIVRRS